MSRYDYDYNKQHEDHLKMCERNLQIGTKVYFPKHDEVLEGVVTERHTGIIDSQGWPTSDPKSDSWIYYATFPGEYRAHWQTYEYKWFFNINDARKASIRELNSRIDDKKRDIVKLEKLKANFEREINETV